MPWLIFSLNLGAQNPYIQHYTMHEGLPSQYVYTIMQDSKKFIWIATEEGVARYDGNEFTLFRKQDGLSSSDVFDIREDSFGRIWFFHINTALDYFYENTIHTARNTPFLDSLRSKAFFRDFYEDSSHNLFFYFNSGSQVFCLTPKGKVIRTALPAIVMYDDIMKKSINAMDIRYIHRNDDGTFLMWSPGGWFHAAKLEEKASQVNNRYRFRSILTASNRKTYAIAREFPEKAFRIYPFSNESDPVLGTPLPDTGSDLISSVLEDTNGIIWISTYDKGVFCFRGDKLIDHFDIRDAKTIIQDHEKNIWITSLKEGIYKINPFLHLHKHFGVEQFDNRPLYALAADKTNGIWCSNGDQLYLYRNREFASLKFTHHDETFNQIIASGKNSLIVWETSKQPFNVEGISVSGNSKRLEYSKIVRSPYVMKNIAVSRDSQSYSSFNQFTIYLFNTTRMFNDFRDFRVPERVVNTYFDCNDNLVVWGNEAFICRDDITVSQPTLRRFFDSAVRDHLTLGDCQELINLDGDSLFILHGNNIINFSSAAGQTFDFQIKHLEYQDSVLYLATSRNIFVCQHPLEVLKGRKVSFLPLNANFRSIHDMAVQNKKIYIASDDGLTEVSADDLHNPGSSTLIPYFRSVQVNEQEFLHQLPDISMTGGNQRINIAFNCINFSNIPVIFSYKLEGADPDWITVNSKNVLLQNLPPGNFRFKLRARIAAANWSEPIELNINVIAPFYKHTLFYFLVLMSVSGIAFLVILRKKNTELESGQLEHQMILLEQKSLQAMMNPHFIFNSLGSIQNYLLHNKPYEAGIYLSQFARLIRQNLNAIDTSMISLEEEVDRIKNYLNLEKLRLGEKFDYAIDVDDNVESDDISIPSMIVQPFVENAIWHGIANLEYNGFVSIRFSMRNEQAIQIIVEDNGVGLSHSEKYGSRNDEHLSMGINITTKRLQLLSKKYGIDTFINLTERDPGTPNPGTRIMIVVPFMTGKPGSAAII